MTPRDLIDCGVQPTQAKVFAAPIAMVMERFAICTLEQRAAFLAQCMHESAGFTRLEEGLWYRSPERITGAFARLASLPPAQLAQMCKNPQALAAGAYGRLNGNRGGASGDGWSYRGSGIIQLTGLRNFQKAQDATGRPYVAQPDLVRTNPEDAVLTAGLFWSWNGCNTAIDEGDFDGVSKTINLGSRYHRSQANGHQERRDFYAQALAALRSN